MLCLREPRWRSPAGQDCWQWAAAALLVGGYRLVADFAGLFEGGLSSAAAGLSDWATATACRRPGLGAARPRPWRRSGRGTRTHGEAPRNRRKVATMASAPRAPRPARPHSPGLVQQGFDAAKAGSRLPGGIAAARRDRGCVAGFAPARQPVPDVFLLPADHRCCRQVGAGGVGQGLAREARRRCFAGTGVWRVFACRVLNGATASTWPPPNSNAVVFEAACRKVSSEPVAAPRIVSCAGHRCHSAGHASRCRPSLRGRGPQLRAGPVGVPCTGNRHHPWAPAPITTGGPRAASGRQPVDRDLAHRAGHRAGRAGPQVDVGALRSSEAGDRPRCPLAPSQRYASAKLTPSRHQASAWAGGPAPQPPDARAAG